MYCQVEIAAWELERNSLESRVDRQFASDDARVNLKRLYPTLDVMDVIANSDSSFLATLPEEEKDDTRLFQKVCHQSYWEQTLIMRFRNNLVHGTMDD